MYIYNWQVVLVIGHVPVQTVITRTLRGVMSAIGAKHPSLKVRMVVVVMMMVVVAVDVVVSVDVVVVVVDLIEAVCVVDEVALIVVV